MMNILAFGFLLFTLFMVAALIFLGFQQWRIERVIAPLPISPSADPAEVAAVATPAARS